MVGGEIPRIPAWCDNVHTMCDAMHQYRKPLAKRDDKPAFVVDTWTHWWICISLYREYTTRGSPGRSRRRMLNVLRLLTIRKLLFFAWGLFWMFGVVFSMQGCVSWVMMYPPAGLPKDMVEPTIGGSDYWANKVRMQYRKTNPEQVSDCWAFARYLVKTLQRKFQGGVVLIWMLAFGCPVGDVLWRLVDVESLIVACAWHGRGRACVLQVFCRLRPCVRVSQLLLPVFICRVNVLQLF